MIYERGMNLRSDRRNKVKELVEEMCSGVGTEEEWLKAIDEMVGDNGAIDGDGEEDILVSNNQTDNQPQVVITDKRDEQVVAEDVTSGPNPAAAARQRNIMKRKRIQQQLKQRRKGEGDEYLSEHQIQGAEHLEYEGDEEFIECDGNRTDDIPEGGYPFTTGLSSKGRNGTLIVITEDGKTWRRRNMRKKGSEQVLEYFNCISCEAVKRYLPTGKFPTLSFLYTPATNVRVLQTNPTTRHHICGNARSTARTTAEQLVRKRKAVARLAGIGSVYAYDSAASEARNLGAAENWDESFLSNVLEEIVTRTPRRSRDQHQSNHNSAPSHSREISSIPDSHFDDSGCSRSSVPKPTATQSTSNQRASSWVKRETSHIGDDVSIQRSVARSNRGNHPNCIIGSLSDSQYSTSASGRYVSRNNGYQNSNHCHACCHCHCQSPCASSSTGASSQPNNSVINYPPEFPLELAQEIKSLVANSNPLNRSGGWQLYTGNDIIVFVRR